MECSMAFTSIEVVFMVPIGPSSRPTHMKFIIQAEITVQVFLQPFSFLWRLEAKEYLLIQSMLRSINFWTSVYIQKIFFF